MFDYEQPPSSLLCILSIDVINIRKCSSGTSRKNCYHADNASPEELLLQPEDYRAGFCGIDLPAEPIDSQNGRGPASGGKIMDKTDNYRQRFFHIS